MRTLGVLAARGDEEVLNVGNLLRLMTTESAKRTTLTTSRSRESLTRATADAPWSKLKEKDRRGPESELRRPPQNSGGSTILFSGRVFLSPDPSSHHGPALHLPAPPLLRHRFQQGQTVSSYARYVGFAQSASINVLLCFSLLMLRGSPLIAATRELVSKPFG